MSEPPYLIRPSPKAMLRFALGSSCAVATLLCLGDGIGILPSSANAMVWIVRVTGLWLSAYVLWSFGFLAVLFALRAITGGIEVHDEGIKLWRFDKLTPWSEIKVLVCEPQPLFKLLCFLPVNVYKLSLYKELKLPMLKAIELTPLSIPSFQFDEDEFRSLLVYIALRCFDSTPTSMNTTMFASSALPELSRVASRGRIMRVVLSLVIAVGLVSFLGRRAAVNYTFNMGNVQFRKELYADAGRSYASAAALDPFFAPAWDRLARTEMRRRMFPEAECHWRMALERKPDFVESKIGLSTILMDRGQLAEAQRLLESAVRLAPTSIPAYISLGQLYLLRDEPDKVTGLLEPLVKREPGNIRARAVLARAYLRMNKTAPAQAVLELPAGAVSVPLTDADRRFIRHVKLAVERAKSNAFDGKNN